MIKEWKLDNQNQINVINFHASLVLTFKFEHIFQEGF